MIISPEFLSIVAGFAFTIYELQRNRKKDFIDISRENNNRYDRLLSERADLAEYYRDPNISLKKLKAEKPQVYEKIMHWELRYFWFCWDEWIESYVRKSVPGYLKKDWTYAIRLAMQQPIHNQAWQDSIHSTDFMGYRAFNKFMDDCVKGRCRIT